MGQAARRRALELYDPDPGGTLLRLLEQAAEGAKPRTP
jgi:hypothetical protein